MSNGRAEGQLHKITTSLFRSRSILQSDTVHHAREIRISRSGGDEGSGGGSVVFAVDESGPGWARARASRQGAVGGRVASETDAPPLSGAAHPPSLSRSHRRRSRSQPTASESTLGLGRINNLDHSPHTQSSSHNTANRAFCLPVLPSGAHPVPLLERPALWLPSFRWHVPAWSPPVGLARA